MAKIPIYNQGRGLTQETPVGSLSRAPNINAFLSPLKAADNIAKKGGQIAFNFGMAEREREDKRIIDQETNIAVEKLLEHKFKDKSTNVPDAQKNFKKVENNILNKIKLKDFGSRREGLIKQNLSKILNSQRLGVMQDSFDRGQKIAADESDQNILKGMDQLRGMDPDSTMFQLQKELIIKNQSDANKLDLPTKYNLINIQKEFQDIAANNTRSKFTDRINSTSNKSSLDIIEKQIEENDKISAPSKDVLRNQIDERKKEIDVETIVKFGDFLPVEKVDETTFGTVDGLNNVVFELSKNNKISDPSLQALWNKADGPLRKRILAEMKTRVTEAKNNILFENQKKGIQEDNINDDLLSTFLPKINDNTATISEIRNAGWKGTKGIAIKNSLITSISNRLEGLQKTDSAPAIYKGINTLIFNGTIKDVTTTFQLPGENSKKNLLQRLNDTISQPDFNHFKSLIDSIKKAPTQLESQERLEAYKRFDEFLAANEDRVKGVFKNMDPTADQTFYDFTVQMRRRYQIGLDDFFERKRKGQLRPGESYLDLLDERKKDSYILKDTDAFFTSPKKNLENFSKSIKKNQDLSLEQLKPPQKPEGMTIDEFKKSKAYQEYITSGRYTQYLDKMKALGGN